ncbi:MAG: purine-nucleoside phosphorylase [Saprospiraceae bacterium]|nr:purine-nucleoside phosphorylase [Saprospiraceae bacterium]
MSTPHNSAAIGQIASTVLMPGDPLRARFIADRFLKNVQLVNDVRNMLGYTGEYNGKMVTVMGTGMGAASTGIYAHEFIHHYGVKQLIRVGSTGSIQSHVNVNDIVIAQGASTDSNFADQFRLPGQMAALANFQLLMMAANHAQQMNLNYHVGNVVSSDYFYHDDQENWKSWAKMGILALEMEAHALYLTAARAGVKALTLLTVSDSLVTGQALSADEREQGFEKMVLLALSLL